MVLFCSFSALLALSSSVLAFPFSGKEDGHLKSSVFEKLAAPPAGWERDDGVLFDKDGSSVKLRIHLVLQNMADFHDLALKIATPGHDLYGSHLDQHVIDSMIAPKDESSDLVMDWLKSQGLDNHATLSARGDSVILEASISQIEKLLDAEYSAFTHIETGSIVVRTLEYSLPDVFIGHVDMVQPTTFFGLKPMRSTIKNIHSFDEASMNADAVQAVSGCSGSQITPKCLSNLYGFSGATAYTAGLMGIAGFLEEYPSKSDLATFMNSYETEGNTAQTYTCDVVNGGSCPTSPGSPGLEANLDVQYARAITEKIPNVFYSVGGSPPIVGSGTNTNEPYLEFLDYLLSLSPSALPNTISISYGDDESTVPLDYANNVCNLFSQLGARGVSVLVASGDAGVGTSCKTGSAKTFTTSFPASCPWVTVVGGTTGNSPEAGWSDSGGGFSSVFGRPSYQNATVSKWLTTDKTHTAVSTYFNSSGRAYPDVAAEATDFVVVLSGGTTLVDGTSCATPTFASVIQLLNSDRVTSGKAGLGFLNPWLYSSAVSGLTDITSGKSTGCSGVISGAGFSAVAGWDPVTGLGTPKYTSLLTISRAT
ncbi:Tripeptidyl-peptidase sed3 [Hyphodiscus hymeniophilus]|uniref:tripeptidyl-peptidase II n=1 Tax=Hyphodiscus hymeniophilus TaxID=353542 RepID=A0A9P6VMG4_9HELO|nr:Tripeptidyl-peptidase sed3 [Hyphodiscus hymeniophilus]